jgi:hypothetical protein
MLMSNTIENAYQSLKQYLPDDAKRVLTQESKRVQKVMDDELEKFKDEMNAHIAFEVEKVTTDMQQELNSTRDEINQQLAVLKSDMAPQNDELETLVTALTLKLESYDQSVTSLIKKAKDKVL